jgi:PleD family two-component response regulator
MATTAAAPASVAPSLATKANDSRKAVVPVDASELEKHVLAVDDKSVDRAAIARILRGSMYRVTAVVGTMLRRRRSCRKKQLRLKLSTRDAEGCRS